MEGIKKDHWYKVELVYVKDTFRLQYSRPGIQLIFRIPEVKGEAKRTLNVPKSFRPFRNIFVEFLGPVMTRTYPEAILEAPTKLARQLHDDLAGKSYFAKLAPAKNLKDIDVIQLKPVGDG